MKKIYSLASLLIAASAAIPAANGAELQPATFEDLELPAESWWVGDTEDEDYDFGSFTSGSFEFSNYYMADWDTWGFFGYANETGNVFPGGYAIADQMLNCVGGGYKSANYGVGFVASYNGPTMITMPDFEETGVQVNGVWVTNTAWVVKAILEGDGMSPAFGQGDYCKITFVGTKADDTTAEVDFYLADYTSEDATKHYYVNEWRYCDLSSLGDIVKIQVNFDSTKSNAYGITTPCYFAFDDLGVKNDTTTGVAAVAAAPEVRVKVAGAVATVTADCADFTVEAVSLAGIRNVAAAHNGAAEVELPAEGVNLLRVVTASGVKTVKVMR